MTDEPEQKLCSTCGREIAHDRLDCRRCKDQVIYNRGKRKKRRQRMTRAFAKEDE